MFLVMYLFLQNLRYTLIPTIVVPVALLGTFGVLFALRLLDQRADHVRHGAGDRHRGRRRDRGGRERRAHHERGRAARRATRRARRWARSPGAIIGITVVLISVFVPLAFFAGSVGNIYRQFSAVMVSVDRCSRPSWRCRSRRRCAPPCSSRWTAGHQHEKTRLLRLVQPRLQVATAKGYESWSRASCAAPARYLLIYAADRRRRGVPRAAPADLVPADRRPGLHDRQRAAAAGRDAGRARWR